jgi:hypothetical protein
MPTQEATGASPECGAPRAPRASRAARWWRPPGRTAGNGAGEEAGSLRCQEG